MPLNIPKTAIGLSKFLKVGQVAVSSLYTSFCASWNIPLALSVNTFTGLSLNNFVPNPFIILILF